MRTGLRFILLNGALLTLSACFGRPHLHPSETDRLSSYGLTPNRPALIVFSALWCHPCRQEIHNINLANSEFGSQIQFLGLLVEGEEKGSPVTPADQKDFTTFSGEPPTYAISMDPNWQQFDTLDAPEGRALPTLVLVGSDGRVRQIIQDSIDYETNLRPLLQALAAEDGSDGGPTPAPTPIPTPTAPQPSRPPVGGPSPTPPSTVWQSLTLPIGSWELRSEVKAQPNLIANVTKSWNAGLENYAFTPEEMTLESGVLNFQWDGSLQDIPLIANWRADTPQSLCTMSITFNPDGTLKSSSGHCRPK